MDKKSLYPVVFFFGAMFLLFIVIPMVFSYMAGVNSPYETIQREITITEKYENRALLNSDPMIVDEVGNKYYFWTESQGLFYELRTNHRYLVNISIPVYYTDQQKFEYEHGLRWRNGTRIESMIKEVDV